MNAKTHNFTAEGKFKSLHLRQKRLGSLVTRAFSAEESDDLNSISFGFAEAETFCAGSERGNLI